jgi:hypothetical protein
MAAADIETAQDHAKLTDMAKYRIYRESYCSEPESNDMVVARATAEPCNDKCAADAALAHESCAACGSKDICLVCTRCPLYTFYCGGHDTRDTAGNYYTFSKTCTHETKQAIVQVANERNFCGFLCDTHLYEDYMEICCHCMDAPSTRVLHGYPFCDTCDLSNYEVYSPELGKWILAKDGPPMKW